jgi:hypothetical protein
MDIHRLPIMMKITTNIVPLRKQNNTHKITAASSWYELLNAVTSLARTHQLDMRRRYEFEGGRLVKWFSCQGRVRPPWQKKTCQECVAWNSN